jgi:beta-barrel assembly-enhancing protease
MSRRRIGALAPLLGVAAAALALAFVSGCSTMSQVGGVVGQATGVMNADQAEALNKSAQAIEKTFQDITPEQEYYIGRAVAATVLVTYKPFDREQANAYLNLIGQTAVQFSAKPETFGGYHFLLLETDEVNAFAAPGGLILVSRGMVRCCKSEDELAAVLAHEISHVDHQHGLKAIRKGRLTSALTTLGAAAGSSLAGGQLAEVTKAFEGSISDITSTMMNSGYSRTTEFEADKGAVVIMKKMGYNPAALVTMLERMQVQLKADDKGFGKTHPSPDVRIAELKKSIGTEPPPEASPVRQERFQRSMGGV